MQTMNSRLIKLVLILLTQLSAYKYKAVGFGDNCGQYCDCGPPARPAHTTVFLTNKKLLYNKSQIFYENESIVKYKCLDSNNLLIGADTRTCLSGKWVGSLPKCGLNLKNSIRLSSIEIYRNGSQITTLDIQNTQDFYNSGLYSVPYYLKPRECTDWTVKSGDELWLFRINQFVDINYIQIVLYSKHNLQNILLANRVPALRLLTNSGGSGAQTGDKHLCQLLTHNYRRHYLTLDYDCGNQHTSNTRLESVVFEYKSTDFSKPFPLYLCELRAYQMPADCGAPDRTLSTTVTTQLGGIHSFSCPDSNHMIRGNSYIKCNKSTGQFTGETPICVPKPYCKLIDNVFGKQMIISYEEITSIESTESVVFDGKLAYFQCNQSNGNDIKSKTSPVAQVICRKGQWFGMSSLPSCEQQSGQPSKDQFTELTDRVTIILMGIIIGILIIPTILLLKRSMRRKSTVFNESNIYDDTNNYDQEHIYAEVDYWNIKEKMKSEEKFNSLKSESNSSRNNNIYVETRI